jgi:hypothetical protein
MLIGIAGTSRRRNTPQASSLEKLRRCTLEEDGMTATGTLLNVSRFHRTGRNVSVVGLRGGDMQVTKQVTSTTMGRRVQGGAFSWCIFKKVHFLGSSLWTGTSPVKMGIL